MDEVTIRHDKDATRCGPFRLTASGLEADGEPTFEEWSACGQFLQRAAGAVQWWVGDWLNYGECRWGTMYKQATETLDMDYQTAADCKWVASVFDSSRRREELSFAHHREVAPLTPPQADALLARAVRGDDKGKILSTREVRQLARQIKNIAANSAQAAGPTLTVEDLFALVRRGRRFGTIYADPPWQYDNQGTRASTDNHYVTMSVEEIAALPVGELAAEKCHLHLWTTDSFLEDAIGLLKGWGFERRQTFVWVKPQLGIGNYWRSSHEYMLLGVRGGLTFPPSNVMSWLEHERTKHSSKPEAVRKLIQKMSPAPRLELFGRQTAEGWTVWGNQIARSMFDTDVEEVS